MSNDRLNPGVVEAARILARIADAFDANNLDAEARKFIYPHGDATPVLYCTYPHDQVVLYSGRGGNELLTLADCEAARAALSRPGAARRRAEMDRDIMVAMNDQRAALEPALPPGFRIVEIVPTYQLCPDERMIHKTTRFVIECAAASAAREGMAGS